MGIGSDLIFSQVRLTFQGIVCYNYIGDNIFDAPRENETNRQKMAI